MSHAHLRENCAGACSIAQFISQMYTANAETSTAAKRSEMSHGENEK